MTVSVSLFDKDGESIGRWITTHDGTHVSLPQASGYNGVVVSFGDGTDSDTVHNLFDHLCGYVVEITTNKPETFTASLESLEETFDAGLVFVVKRWLDADGEYQADASSVLFDDITHIHIF